MKSLTELYKIGAGPSSSHTMGPEKACKIFAENYKDADSFKVILYGSLAMTGKGHGTDRIVISTLKKPTEVVFNTEEKDIPHENTMDLIALSHGNVIDRWRVLSVGGGAIEIVGRGKYDPPEVYDLNSFSEIAAYCKKHRIRIPDYVERVEGPEIFDYLKKIWAQMKDTVQNGLDASGTIPGGLNLQRKAKFLFRQRHIDESPETRENRLVCAFAYAVSEENACGHTIVTAPTCGSSGVVPAVLTYMQDKRGFSDKEIVRALATAGIVGNIVKQNASISGAECGCQAEIGTACSMACRALRHGSGTDRIRRGSRDGASSWAYVRSDFRACANPLHRKERRCRNARDKRRIPCKFSDRNKKNIFRYGCRNDVRNGQGSEKELPRNRNGRACETLSRGAR